MIGQGDEIALMWAMVIISLVHSVVLMRVCLHVIDRVFAVPREKDQ